MFLKNREQAWKKKPCTSYECFNRHISTLGSTFVFWIGIVIIRERFACLAKLPSPNSLGKSEPSTLLSGDSCRTGGIQELVNSIHSSI